MAWSGVGFGWVNEADYSAFRSVFTAVAVLGAKKRTVRRWHFVGPLVAMACLIVPWTFRNQAVYHQFLILNSNAGYALFASNNPNLGTDWRNDEVVVLIPEEMYGLNDAQLDQALARQGIKFILADPKRYASLTLNKMTEYFRFWPSSESAPISNLNRVLSFGLYLQFMLLGLALSLSRWRRYTPLSLFIGIHTAIYLLTWPSPRYRLPVDAVLIVFASLAVLELSMQLLAWRCRLPLMVRPVSELGDRG